MLRRELDYAACDLERDAFHVLLVGGELIGFHALSPLSPLSARRYKLEAPCAVLAEALSEDHRYFTALQLAARLRSDAISLTRILGQMDLPPRGHAPVSLDLLHAVRLAAIQHCFLIAARLPDLTPQGGGR